MALLPFTCPLTLPRGKSNCLPIFSGSNILQLKDLGLQKWHVQAVSKNSASQDGVPSEGSNDKVSKSTQRAPRRGRKKVSTDNVEEDPVSMVSSPEEAERNSPVTSPEEKQSTQRAPRRGKKKVSAENVEEDPVSMVSNPEEAERNSPVTSPEESKKVKRRGRKKAIPVPSSEEDTTENTVTKRRTRKKIDIMEDQSMTKSMPKELTNPDEPVSSDSLRENEEPHIREDEEEDISFTYNWPPLVCCFGAAQHAFVPSGRPANRLIDYEIHKSMRDMFWSPTKFVRAPGGSSSNVAIALAALGGRVEFMGKLGDDDYGQQLLYHLNVNKVQTRSVKFGMSKPTAVSHMKISRRGGIRASCVKPCAEDSFLSSEIYIDVLKEAKMFYFNSSSLIDQNMRSTTMEAIEISKKLGGVIFYDLNLPLPLWKSSEETKSFIQQAWNYADIIEVTKQELEFLCGIEPMEKFDAEDNDKSKFIHHKSEVIMPLWHDNLKVLFVTNGTSKVHYYTEKDNGWVHGMEDAPITPFTGDMSVSGDAIVAALMRMLTVQPHLATDKGYLEHIIKYAINCGVIDQWLLARGLGFPPKEGMEVSSSDPDKTSFTTEKEYRMVGELVEELVD